ncbi:MAG: hypothetical protein HYZ72_05875, partial [Deltaproteobacteria bacterium]|nr:hypothetical protein [Deltaproteobacteria bacterium]
DVLTYFWSLTTKPTGSTAMLSDPTAVQPTFVIDRPGTYTAQLIVNDGTVDSTPATVTLSTVNSKPVANPGPDQSGFVGTTITLDGSASSDGDGDPLTYQWALVSQPANSTATLLNPTTAQPSFTLDKPATYTVQLIVNDGALDSAPASVTISTLNAKPVAEAGPAQAVLVGATVHLDGSGSTDGDGDALSYFWALTVLPAGSTATLSNDTAVNPTFVPDVAGTYVVQLIVQDGTVESAPNTVAITVTEPDTTPPPPPDLGRITVSPVTNRQVTITGTAGSVEGNARVTITSARTGQTVMATANADGSFTVQLVAPEGDVLSLVVTDAAGNVSAAAYSLVKSTPAAPQDTLFQSIWDDMNAALLAGDKTQALTFLTASAQRKYGPVFDRLLPYMPQIIASYSPLQQVSLSADIGEYAVMRVIDGQLRLFLIYFLKDADGVWRLDAM